MSQITAFPCGSEMNWKLKLLREMNVNEWIEREYLKNIFRPPSTDECMEMAKAWEAQHVR